MNEYIFNLLDSKYIDNTFTDTFTFDIGNESRVTVIKKLQSGTRLNERDKKREKKAFDNFYNLPGNRFLEQRRCWIGM